ncbi:uncharacterized protein LOC121647729 [Melanotaenia boesemani]|uniref:uncharacterized protein LOC121647729 n=1 Tax=Melanotaenia boesemani TaxID=1250792 RepID=UPI001C059D39|nr:uncharacterized protein LOC121647729 [Melanotaenia boesemani]
MVDRNIALEALCTLCNANVTSVQKQSVQAQSFRGTPPQQSLKIKNFISTVLDADETSQVSRSNFECIKTVLQSGGHATSHSRVNPQEQHDTTKNHVINEDEFFDNQYDYDFANLKDTETYTRGGEVYERPSGWYGFGLKVLDKYESNAWLGTRFRSTQSVPGEWPVSYHGTTKRGAEGIIEGFYKSGPGQVYGKGIYSTPYISEAELYAKTFTSNKNGKQYKVILQNRINPKYRQKYNNQKYWLVPIPDNSSAQDERVMVEQAIRPYGLLLKEVTVEKDYMCQLIWKMQTRNSLSH